MQMVGVRSEWKMSSPFQWDEILNNQPAALPQLGVRFVVPTTAEFVNQESRI